ncbi:amidase [Arthrobacter phage Abidatro]|uniref:Lysin A n=1 Tax=Arthrobacter phage Abidatro TaxID=2015853 RepID=A0A222ZES2_9CAUD|nr:amidase [Arthrobacter phage Abidatro]ASR83194.1 lysin A [Arthrobacter phage Abidatro]
MTYQLHEEYSCDFTGPERTPLGIAIHWWDDPKNKPTFWNIVNLLLERSRQRSASVNFVAEAGLVACLVSPNVVAWAQGDGASGWGNNNLISIECNPRCTPEDRETVAELIADQRLLWGSLPLYPHNKFTATQCPGVWEQWLPWLDRRANEIMAAKRGQAAPVVPASAPAPAAPAPAPAADNRIHWVVERGDTLGGIAAHYGGPSAAQIAAYNGIPDANRIEVGQRIYIPGPLVWIVDPGDTLGAIGAHYGMSAETVAANNGLNVNAPIFPGQRLRIID